MSRIANFSILLTQNSIFQPNKKLLYRTPSCTKIDQSCLPPLYIHFRSILFTSTFIVTNSQALFRLASWSSTKHVTVLLLHYRWPRVFGNKRLQLYFRIELLCTTQACYTNAQAVIKNGRFLKDTSDSIKSQSTMESILT